jgi:hypothetical protein
VQDLEEAVEQRNSDTTQIVGADWLKEKQMLSQLVVKNQQIAEDLEYKMVRKEEEFDQLLKEREKLAHVEKSVLESENRVLKEVQN